VDFSFNEFIEYFIRFIIVYFITSLAWSLVEHHFVSQNQVREQVIEKLNKIVHRVNCEKHQDMYYWFDQDSNEFLAQGRDLDEIKEKLKKHFANHVFVISDRQMLVGPDFKTVEVDLRNLPKVDI